jgi:hypothetical protein
MRFVLLVLAVLAFLSSPAAAGEGTSYGAGLTGTEVVKISELMANPDAYLGKTVRVEGLVLDVCSKRGCWMDLASDKEFQTIRIKVEDGVIVFPLEAKGKTAVAEGVLTKRELTEEQAIAWKKHEAECAKSKFDEASHTGPMTLYMIEGKGAVIR